MPVPRRLKVRIGDPIRPSLDAMFDLELTFISWTDSCKNPLLTNDGDFRQCRRALGHEGEHCSGFRSARVRWL